MKIQDTNSVIYKCIKINIVGGLIEKFVFVSVRNRYNKKVETSTANLR